MTARSLALLLPAVLACGATNTIGIRAIYTDLDGTALRHKDGVPHPETVSALREFREKGGHLGIASGRTPQQLGPALSALEPDLPLVLFNGAVVISPDLSTVLAVKPLDPAVAVAVQATLGSAPTALRGVVVHFLRRTVVTSDVALAGFLAKARIRADAVVADLAEAARAEAGNDPLVKLLLIVAPEVAPGFAAHLQAALGESAHAVLTDPKTACVEITAPGAQKAQGIRTALAGSGLQPKDVLVLGDSPNDAEMLGEFPNSVAMGNCTGTACQAAAARMCRACTSDTDAISRVVRRYVLGRDDRPDPFSIAPCNCRE